jgi:hypothetical protein
MLAGFLSITLLAYPLGMSGIRAPSPMNQFATEFEFQHRFYGDILDTNSTFLGMDQGANANLELSFYPIKGLSISVSRISSGKETHLGVSYSHTFRKIYLKARVGFDIYTYPNDTRYWGYFPNFTVQTEPILGRIEPFLTLGYDSDMDGIFNWGVGLSVTVLKDFYYFTEIALIGEYHPHPRGVGYIPELRPEGIYLFGIGASTYGHQFLFTLSNTTNLGARQLMYGRVRYMDDVGFELRFGFTIRRLLSRGKES